MSPAWCRGSGRHLPASRRAETQRSHAPALSVLQESERLRRAWHRRWLSGYSFKDREFAELVRKMAGLTNLWIFIHLHGDSASRALDRTGRGRRDGPLAVPPYRPRAVIQVRIGPFQVLAELGAHRRNRLALLLCETHDLSRACRKNWPQARSHGMRERIRKCYAVLILRAIESRQIREESGSGQAGIQEAAGAPRRAYRGF